MFFKSPKVRRRLLILILMVLPGTLIAEYLSKVPNAAEIQKAKVGDKKVIGSWNIDLVNSLLKLHNIFYDQKAEKGEAKSTIDVGRAIVDYLYYKDHKDELYYSMKINDLVYIYDN